MFTQDQSDEIRSNFPIFKNFTFLNSASMAPLPVSSSQVMAAFLEDLTQNAFLNMGDWIKTASKARALGAKIVGADTQEIAFIRNTSDGISLVASGYPFQPSDEVIINDLEFPSNVYPWLNLKQKQVNVKIVKNVEGRVPLEAIAKEVTSRTKIVAISTVQFSTGFRADIKALGALAREKGFLLFVDAIQSLGLIPMDVKAMGVDFLSCGGHKWLCAPEGIGLFFCDEKHLETLNLTRLGWNSVVDSLNFETIDFKPKPSAGRFEEASANMVGIYGLAESLKLIMERGISNNFAHVLELNSHLVDRLRSKDYNIFSPEQESERSGIIIFSGKDNEVNKELNKRLSKEKVMVIPRGGGIRVSPHFFNTIDDIERLLEIV